MVKTGVDILRHVSPDEGLKKIFNWFCCHYGNQMGSYIFTV